MSDGTITLSELSGLSTLGELLGKDPGDDLDVDQRIALSALDQERTLLAHYEECRQFLLESADAWTELLTRYLALKDFRRQLMLNAVLTSNAMQYRPTTTYPLNDSIKIEQDYKRLIAAHHPDHEPSAITRRAISMVQSTDDEWAPLQEEYTAAYQTRYSINNLLGPIEIALRHNRAVLESACRRASGLLPDLEELTFPPRPPL